MGRISVLFLTFFLFNLEILAISDRTAIDFAIKSIKGKGLCSKSVFPAKISAVPISDNQDVRLVTVSSYYVLVGGSEYAPQLLGYGSDIGNIPQPLVDILADLQKGAILRLANINFMSVPGMIPDFSPVEPFLNIMRSQKTPFNAMCPYYRYADGTLSANPCVAGCVATAMEPILSYYQYPSELKIPLKGWVTPNYAIDSIPAYQKIDYSHILDEYKDGQYSKEEKNAVASLTYYCGISVGMDWNVNSSGARDENIVIALKNVFGYEKAKLVYSSDYSFEKWHQLLYEELSAQRPVYFIASNSTLSSHAFLIDGIDENGMYHVKWGYGGDYDGYFDLSLLDQYVLPKDKSHDGKMIGFYANHEAILIHPANIDNSIENDTLPKWSRVVVDSVKFERVPDQNRYNRTLAWLRNRGDQAVQSSCVFFTHDADDSTAVVDVVGYAGELLQPGESKCVEAFLKFSYTGNRVFSIATDDSLYAYNDTVCIVQSKEPQVETAIVNQNVKSTEAEFVFSYQNKSSDYWAGNLITYCLYEGVFDEENENFWKNYKMNLAPCFSAVDTVGFHNLKPNNHYTLLVRNLWKPVHQIDFITPNIDKVEKIVTKKSNQLSRTVLLDGISINGRSSFVLPTIQLEEKEGRIVKRFNRGRR